MQQLNPPDYSDPPPDPKEQENRCPDCLFMDLNFGESDNLGFQATTEQDFPGEKELYLTLNFNEEWLELRGGRVKFGIRAGELRLILNNGKVPYSHRNLNDPLRLSTEREVETQQGRESGSNVGGSLSQEKAELTAKQDQKRTKTRKEKFQKVNFHVSTKGTEEEPKWVFEADRDDPILRGTLADTQLATVKIMGNPHEVIATFEVSDRDVYLRDAEGIWPQNISRKKLAVIERLIIMRQLASKLKPISKVELRHG